MPEQMDLLEGIKRRDEGKTAVEANGVKFVDYMRRLAADISRRRGSVSADDLRRFDGEGISPHHPNAWGAIFRGKGWACVGRNKSEFVDNHAREIRVWVWKGEAR